MADIFISYSSKDREKAEQLSELLASAGLSVWIDESSIDLSTNWSKEIVQGIDSCKAFIVLLSQYSIGSKNVIREVALAFEKNKKILPLDLEPITLSEDLQYLLAGIQRAPISNIDAIIRALGKLGLEATKIPELKLVKDTSGKKSLMVLPFEDLSPTADNEWFANGITTELISTLSYVKALRVIDQQTTKEFMSYKGHLAAYAKEMSIRYFIQGSVRRFGDQLKITAALLDIETGDHLWQDSLKGTMEDIFSIQETVAKKVVGGLSIILTPQEKEKVVKKPTVNAEAYELYLKGSEYASRQTKSDLDRALILLEEAVRLDPSFTSAYVSIATYSQEIYRQYHRSTSLLERAEAAAEKVRELEGDTARYFKVMSQITLTCGDVEGGLRFALRSRDADSNAADAYAALGTAYSALGNHREAVKAWEHLISIQENDRTAHYNLLINLQAVGDPDRLRAAAERAVPIYERYTRINPDDFNARVLLANILEFAGRQTESLQAADALSLIGSLDGSALYNLACLYLRNNFSEPSIGHLRRAIAKGFRGIETFRHDPDLALLRGTPEFEALVKDLEGKIANEKLTTTLG